MSPQQNIIIMQMRKANLV